MAQKENFSDRLEVAIRGKDSILCVGIDPQVEHIPQYLREKYKKEFQDPMEAVGRCVLEFSKAIIDACGDYVACVKPQAAFFEQFGHWGVFALEETIKYAKEKNLLVLLDAKRGDGGATAEAYAAGYLGQVADLDGNKGQAPLKVDAMTIHTWIGEACVEPFLSVMAEEGAGAFCVTKTSFKPNSVVENLISKNDRPIWEEQAELVKQWGEKVMGKNGFSALGVVMGATYPEEAKKMREILPKSWFLVPGYGAQGGGAKDAVAGMAENGLGILVNSARGISTAHMAEGVTGVAKDGQGFEGALMAAAKKAKEELNEARGE